MSSDPRAQTMFFFSCYHVIRPQSPNNVFFFMLFSCHQTPESKKEEFRKYLEKSGVIDALTKVLVGLYEEPERPPNAVDYIKRYDRLDCRANKL